MAIVLSSSRAALALDTIMPRARETVTDIEREIEQYISKLRAQSALGLADECPVVANQLVSATCTQRHRSFTEPAEGQRRSTEPELLLRAIFDTPECRTESSSALLGCRLRRRGATFHRVEHATVEATERRFHRWAFGHDLSSDDDDSEAARRYYFLVDDASSKARRSHESDDKGGPRQHGPPSLSPTPSEETIDESLCSTASPTSFVAGDDIWSVHSSASDSSEPLVHDAPASNRSSVASPTPHPRNPPGWSDIDITLTPPEPPSDHRADHQDGPVETPASEDDAAETATSTDTTKVKTWRRLAAKGIPSVPRVKSVSRRAKRQVAQNQRAAAAKARVIGDSFTDRISSRVFGRMEVQEIIDCSAIQRRSIDASQEDVRSNTGSETLEFAGHSSLHDHLPSIPEVSLFQDEDKEAIFPSSSDIAARSSSNLGPSPTPTPGQEPRHVVSALSDRSQRTSASSSDDLDWIAFQMAISGPTGDYFMAGDATADDDEKDEDDIIAWFLGWGFESEGLLLTSEDGEEVDGIEHEANLTALREAPSAIRMPPTASSPPSKSDEPALRPQVHAAESDRWQMSCNLNDLGDFLDVFHLGALGGDYMNHLDL